MGLYPSRVRPLVSLPYDLLLLFLFLEGATTRISSIFCGAVRAEAISRFISLATWARAAEISFSSAMCDERS